MNGHSRIARAGSTTLTCVLAVLALAGCSREPASEAASGVGMASPAAPEALPPEATTGAVDDGRSIPAAAHGRWGLVPADCTSTAGDAKGLLIVDATTLKFYESLARIGEIKERDANRIRATFAFSGEGQEWTQDVLLDVQDEGRTMVRRDYGPDAMPGALQYTRCGDDRTA